MTLKIFVLFFVAEFLFQCTDSRTSDEYQILRDTVAISYQGNHVETLQDHGSDFPESPSRTTRQSSNQDTDDSSSFSFEYDRFDWMLTKRVASLYEGNFLLSPVALKLSMLFIKEASTTDTLAELASIFRDSPDRNVNRNRFEYIVRLLKEESAGNPRLSSQIYISDKVVRRQRIMAIGKELYGIDMTSANFDNLPEVVRNINLWISNITEGFFTSSIHKDDLSNVVMLVLNTLYMGGTWYHRFDLNSTRINQFYVTPSTLKILPFMKTHNQFFYAESIKFDAKILRMPYLGHNFALYLIVPNSLTGLPRVLENLSLLTSELKYLRERYVEVTFPKFKYGHTIHLQEILKEMNLRQAFEMTASFPGIARGSLSEKDRIHLSNVIQTSVIEFNEYGSSGFSSTDIPLANGLDEDADSEEVVVDRPFFFFVQDQVSRHIMFMGRVMDPTVTDSAFIL